MVDEIWKRADNLSWAYEDVNKLFKSSKGKAALLSLNKSARDQFTTLDEMLDEYSSSAAAPEKYREAALANLNKAVDEADDAASRINRIKKMFNDVRRPFQEYLFFAPCVTIPHCAGRRKADRSFHL